MEFEIKGVQYRTAKLSVFDQLKVSRKLLPVLAGMMADFQSIKAATQGGDVYKAMETALPKIADSLADMTEEDTNAIIFPCLSVVSRKNGNAWAPVMNQGELMFDDIDLLSMLQMVGRVVGDSLGNFLPAAPGSETAPR
ncbi:hypothetical protein FZI02_20810 [Cronobacter sakazakii]|uniref:phage tail assembly chaperone n=1 Tax=Cronobacter sakazakii TaxID=28141 RepID=UPI001327C090|nr:hypothetical protein [Cronobacter sakazakii]EGT5186451.1 hypothetical protein [Cronobacter sakazakii]EJG0748346.1 hypothetical protein [Cronobacter sakazakii]ELY2536549.1 hypothetical protein [Cronobacter sakazakii]ELY2540610.1 hypothetical protein [Cronobacter sakazakii]ELY4823288.1 hypothetical protein [Cronobacter sakazakii]